MQKPVFAIFDRVSGEMTGPLFVQPSEASARRLFSDAITAPESQLSKHGADYSLHKLGDLNVQTGEFQQEIPFAFDLDRAVIDGQTIIDLQQSAETVG